MYRLCSTHPFELYPRVAWGQKAQKRDGVGQFLHLERFGMWNMQIILRWYNYTSKNRKRNFSSKIWRPPWCWVICYHRICDKFFIKNYPCHQFQCFVRHQSRQRISMWSEDHRRLCQQASLDSWIYALQQRAWENHALLESNGWEFKVRNSSLCEKAYPSHKW